MKNWANAEERADKVLVDKNLFRPNPGFERRSYIINTFDVAIKFPDPI